jgi:hypothetical protein
MPGSKLPDLAVQEYARHPYKNIGEVKPYYTYIFHQLAHKVTNKTRNNNIRNMLAKETRNYMRQLKNGAPISAPVPVAIPTPKINRSNKKTQKRKANNPYAPPINRSKTNRNRLSMPTYTYVEQGTNAFNHPYYKANATGYIPALNYMSNNNV